MGGFRSHVPFRPDIASRAVVSHPLHMPFFRGTCQDVKVAVLVKRDRQSDVVSRCGEDQISPDLVTPLNPSQSQLFILYFYS